MPRKSNSRSALGSSAAARRVEVVVEQRRVDALDRDAVLERRPQGAAVRLAQPADAVAEDRPSRASPRRRRSAGSARRTGRSRCRARPATWRSSRSGAAGRRAARPGGSRGAARARSPRASSASSSPIRANAIRARRSAPSQSVSAPSASSTGIAGTASGRRQDRCCGAQQRALGAVDDVALGDAHVAGEHELLLDDVLDRLDRDVRRAQRAGALGDPAGQRAGRGGVVHAATGTPCGSRSRSWPCSRGRPRRCGGSAAAPGSARRWPRPARARGHHQRLGDLVMAGVDQRRLDQRREVGAGDHGRARVAESRAITAAVVARRISRPATVSATARRGAQRRACRARRRPAAGSAA